MFQIHLFQLVVYPSICRLGQRVTRYGGFAPANCLPVCQSGHLGQSMLLTFSLGCYLFFWPMHTYLPMPPRISQSRCQIGTHRGA